MAFLIDTRPQEDTQYKKQALIIMLPFWNEDKTSWTKNMQKRVKQILPKNIPQTDAERRRDLACPQYDNAFIQLYYFVLG